MASQPFIDKDTAQDAFIESQNWLRVYMQPIDEFERLARNKPSDKIEAHLPKVTDGTLAAVIQESPKRIIQQTPTGRVICHDYPEYAAIADIVLSQRLMSLYNRMGNVLQKDWNMLSKAMTWGRSASYTFFTSTNGQLHTDFVIPYVRDVISEKGKVFAPDSNIVFMRSWYQKRDLKAIIQREKQLEKTIKGYTSDWDLKALADLMSGSTTTKTAEQMTPAEKEKGDGYSGGYEVIHAFQKGKGAEMYSFAPRFEEGKPLRTKANKDPRGLLPIDFLYCNIDLSNPMGRGVPEISGGIQNLIDQQMQMFQFESTMEMGPPLKKWGNVNTATLQMRPGKIWDMGGPKATGNDVEPYAISNYALANFSNNYGLLKSQILQLNNAEASATVSADSGNPSFSKTQAGVQAQQNQLSLSDNYLRKQFEAWDEDQRETSLNIFFAEMTGSEQIELGPQQLQELSSTPAAKFIKDGKLNVNYKQISDVVFKFDVDPNSSKGSNDADQIQKLQELLQELGQNGPVLSYYLGQAGKKLNPGEIYAQLFKRLGLENLDSILTDMDDQEKQQAMQQPFPIIDKPQIRMNSADLPTPALLAALQAGGVNVGMPPSSDPTAYATPQALLDYQVEMMKAQAALQSAQSKGQGTSPEEMALRQQELALKQQQADDGTTKTALEISKTAHQHTMDLHQAALAASQPQQPPQNGPSDGQTGDSPAPSGPAQPLSPEDAAEPPQQQAMDEPMTPDEEQFAQALMHRGFDEATVEQAIVMKRRGMPTEQIIATIGAKLHA